MVIAPAVVATASIRKVLAQCPGAELLTSHSKELYLLFPLTAIAIDLLSGTQLAPIGLAATPGVEVVGCGLVKVVETAKLFLVGTPIARESAAHLAPPIISPDNPQLVEVGAVATANEAPVLIPLLDPILAALSTIATALPLGCATRIEPFTAYLVHSPKPLAALVGTTTNVRLPNRLLPRYLINAKPLCRGAGNLILPLTPQ